MSTAKRVTAMISMNGLLIALFALSAAPAKAAVMGTYVDADPTGGSPNTTPAGAFPPSFTYAGSYTDNLWDVRTGLGTGNTVIEAGGQGSNGAENPPLITTSVTGLAPGTYDIYVLFGSTTTADWSVRAALSGGSLVEYDRNSVGVIDTGFLPGTTAIDLYEMKIGTVVSVTSFAVDVRNSTHTGIVATFYDGVAYALVPEPASVVLFAAAAASLLIRRRAGK